MPSYARHGLSSAAYLHNQPVPGSQLGKRRWPPKEGCAGLDTVQVANKEIEPIEDAIARMESKPAASNSPQLVIKPCASSVMPPIHQLPAELLEDIFHHVLSITSVSTWRQASLIPLSFVCRRWYRVTLDSQRLWSNIHFDSSHILPSQISRFHGMLQSQRRVCHSYRLQVVMFVSGHNVNQSPNKGEQRLGPIDHLNETRHMWDTATLRISTEVVLRVFTSSSEFPFLRKLDIDLFPEPGIPSPSLQLTKVVAPQLHEIKFSYSCYSSVILPWSQLIRVSVSNISMPALCEVIRSLGRIEELNVKLSSDGILCGPLDGLEFPPTFRSLALLGLEGRTSEKVHHSLLQMLRAFHAPSLQTLQLSGLRWSTLPALDVLLNNSVHHSITNLSIQLFYLLSPQDSLSSVQQLIRHLGKLPKLKKLTASYFRTSSSTRDPMGQITNADLLFVALSERDQDRFVMCPLLSSLDLSVFTVSPQALESAIWARIGRASLSCKPELFHLKEVFLSGCALSANGLTGDEWRASQSGIKGIEGVLRGYCTTGQYIELLGPGYTRAC